MSKNKEVTFKTIHDTYVFVVRPSTTKEINGEVIPVPGKRVEFKNGILKTSDPETIEALRNDKFFNIDYFENAKDFVKGRKAIKKAAEKKSESETATETESKKETKKNVEGFECEYCGKVCKTKGGLQAHIRKSKDEKHPSK